MPGFELRISGVGSDRSANGGRQSNCKILLQFYLFHSQDT